jgi:hypothetical protein
MIDFFSPLFSSVRFPSLSYKLVSTFFLVILFGFSYIVFSDLGHIYAQESSDCDRQTFSLVDCPGFSSGDGRINNNNDGQNIEQQIPSVIPFP